MPRALLNALTVDVEEWFHVDAERVLPDAKKLPRLSLVS